LFYNECGGFIFLIKYYEIIEAGFDDDDGDSYCVGFDMVGERFFE